MVTPSARLKAARHLVESLSMSVRMACKIVGIARSTYYYEPKARAENERILRELHRLAKRFPRYGYQRMTQKLKQQGWRVNRKRVQRLWREAGLKVYKKAIKRKRIGASTRERQEALYPNHVWSWDFLFDRTANGRLIKILNIVDEYSRFNIHLEAKRNFSGNDVVCALGTAMVRYGIPGCIRSDNGSEFIASRVKDWLEDNGIGIQYIDPASPWQNPYVESLNGRLRDECLNRELFSSLLEAQIVLEDWRKEYNTKRPHSGIDFQTPGEIFERFIPTGSMEPVAHLTTETGEHLQI